LNNLKNLNSIWSKNSGLSIVNKYINHYKDKRITKLQNINTEMISNKYYIYKIKPERTVIYSKNVLHLTSKNK